MTAEREAIRAEAGPLEPAKRLGDVGRARKILGHSRDGSCRFQEPYGEGGEPAPAEMARRPPIPADRVAAAVEEAAVAVALERPAFGQARAANEPKRRGSALPRRGCAASGGATTWRP